MVLIFFTSSSICLSFDFTISYSFPNFNTKIFIVASLPQLDPSADLCTCLCGLRARPLILPFFLINLEVRLFQGVNFLLFFLLPQSHAHFGNFAYFRQDRWGIFFLSYHLSNVEDQFLGRVGDSIGEVFHILFGQGHLQFL